MLSHEPNRRLVAFHSLYADLVLWKQFLKFGSNYIAMYGRNLFLVVCKDYMLSVSVYFKT